MSVRCYGNPPRRSVAFLALKLVSMATAVTASGEKTSGGKTVIHTLTPVTGGAR